MPYGLKNAGAAFQRMIDTLFANLDDLLIASNNETEHLFHMK